MFESFFLFPIELVLPDETLAAAAESPGFEAEEAKEVEVKEDEKPRILLKRQSKDETTGRMWFRVLFSLYFMDRKHKVFEGSLGLVSKIPWSWSIVSEFS